MSFENLTIKEVMEIKKMFAGNEPADSRTFMQKGKVYLIRTVTFTLAGKLKDFSDKEFLFEECDWIADTGRFADNLVSCSFSEVEPFANDVIVNRSSFVDCTEIKSTPRKQK